jgi:signal transduction histidine kinase
MLQRCAQAMVGYLDAALVRIWTLNTDQDILELGASAGIENSLDGPDGRVPVGMGKIGRIAKERKPHLTNDLHSDSATSEQDLVHRQRMTAFAGYPLIFEGRLMGVMALYARTPLAQEAIDLLPPGAQLIAQGIARKATEHQREQLLVTERAARNEAERAARSKDEFLATISHELRTPLQAIIGWAAVLSSSGTEPDDIARAVEVIERNAYAQARLVDDLLDMSRIITGKIHLDMQQVELQPVIGAALETIRPSAEAKGVRILTTLDAHTGPVVGDANRLQQIIWNILSNAVKFTPEGGKVEVMLKRVDSQAEIAVSDTGQGIAPEFLPYVFDEFQQADASTSRKHGGMGLGMAIVKHLVELHKGTVRAESLGEGLGATFRVNLPLATEAAIGQDKDGVFSAETDETTEFGGPGTGGSLTLRGVRILVVDDEADARELIKRVLEDHEAEVTTAQSVPEALQAFENFRPDVLVSDIGMPGLDGYDLIRGVRELEPERGGRTPAVALTALVRSSERRRALHAGYQMHISKPVAPSRLVAALASLAKRKGG